MVVFKQINDRKDVMNMEKLQEKKNFGIPVKILVLFAYLIGYSLTKSLSGTLLVAVLFAAAVFTFQFDDKVKNAVKHSYLFAVVVQLVYFILELVGSFINFLFGGRVTSINSFSDMFYTVSFFQKALNFLYAIGLLLVNAAVIIIFAIFIIMALMNKDLNIGFVSNILSDEPIKKYKNPTYNQAGGGQPNYNQPPVPPVPPFGTNNYAPQAPAQAPQAPVQTQAPQASVQAQASAQQNAGGCPKCGKVNHNEAVFCAACGTKLK